MSNRRDGCGRFGGASRRTLAMRLVGAAVFAIYWAGSSVQSFSSDAIDFQDLPKNPRFNRDVRPILANSCYPCHGPDKYAREGKFRLDLREEALADRDDGAAIVPGNSPRSALIQRITHEDPGERMPPADSGRLISVREIEVLRRWIDAGAEYEKHWAYIPPKRPELLPGSSAATAIDRFIFAKLQAKGIAPSPRADPRTLLRRLTLDITGLPPTAAETESFEADAGRENYEAQVDRLLSSRHYGERMAVHWLDLVRYADSNGYHSDEYRSIWPYRDYVIRAFNDNKPYDEFTVEQLAGDLLPDASREQRVASGYNRLNQITAEGGAQAKEYFAKYAADRIRTLGTVWMGATLGCVECHEHKFDPYVAKDFYSFGAFFADIDEVGVYPGQSSWNPILKLPSQDEIAKRNVIHDRIETLERALGEGIGDVSSQQRDWERRSRIVLSTFGKPPWMPIQPDSAISEAGATLELLDDQSVLSTGLLPQFDNYTVEITTNLENITGLRLDALGHPSFERALTRTGPFFVLSELEVELLGPDAESTRSVPIADAQGRPISETYPVSKAIDGDNATGWLVRSGDKPGAPAQAVFRFEDAIPGGLGTRLRIRLLQESSVVQTHIGRFRISLTTVEEPALSEHVGSPEHIVNALLKPAGERSRRETSDIGRFYRQTSEEWAPKREAIETAYSEIREIEDTYATTLITKSVEARVMRVLPRGNWMDDSGEIVEPAVPSFLPPLNVSGRRATRLDLARWLVDDANPLVARAFVNRLWKMFYGTGISKVLDDLGAQGEWPVHPELLDWLAVEFRESGWDIKHVVKLMVMSDAYQRSSRPRDDLRDIDPGNRLLARQSARRIDAEMVRDSVLAVSGLLVRTVGGPSVKPYQPAGYWQHLYFPARTYEHDTGESQYRRGLYTHWQRSFLHPSLMAFDAPSREECTAERNVSNTPLQALALLNDPTYMEAARVFAARILEEGGDTFEARLDWAYLQALNRHPSANERILLQNLFEKHLEEYRADESAARAAVSIGESPVPDELDLTLLASWTSVARTIFNLHEMITRA